MDWRTHFEALGARADALVGPGEQFTLGFKAEDSDFVRFNRGLVRQPGTVHDAALSVRWLRGRRQVSAEVTLTGDLSLDLPRLDAMVADLRHVLPSLPEDPHVLLNDVITSTEQITVGQIPDAREVAEQVVQVAREGSQPLDLVGIYAGGASYRGFRNHFGQVNWFDSRGFVLDWCLVQDGDRAVKSTWAAPAWDPTVFRAKMDEAARDLAVLSRPPKRLAPGAWRSFLTPAALEEILDLVTRDGFSASAQRRKRSCLGLLVSGERELDPRVSLVDDTAGGIAPAFQSDGFLRPDQVELVRQGKHAGSLVSPRTAVEHGLVTNGADGWEQPSSLHLRGGDLPMAEARSRLDTGVWVSNLWYANHSDHQTARITGMTRFATLWVEGGEAVAPVQVMRFDDSLYALLGSALESLTTETSFLASPSTYGWRSTASMRLPGALVSGLTLTL